MEREKDIVRRFYREAIVERDPSACERLLGTGFVHNGEPRGQAGQRRAVEYFLGVAATGRRVEFTSTAILRVEGEVIVEAWDELDTGASLTS